MWNEPTEEQLSQIPRLYGTERVPLNEKPIYLHFFIGNCDWYIVEYDEGEDLFWGYAILNGDFEMAEWGYISFQELKELVVPPGFEVDCEAGWQVKRADEIEKIRIGNQWPDKNTPKDNPSRKEKADEACTHSGVGRDH